MKHIHLISIGGAVMHNIALALQIKGYKVSGSDDEIYEPSRSRLSNAGLLPAEMGWFPEKITDDIDEIILGMHAREGNPEILKAMELNIPMYSFPEFIYRQALDKKRIVVAGSHGKTSTTSMIMHALKEEGIDFDYLVGGQIDGFDLMVRFSDANIMILEGDEYLSSALDKRPKMHWYRPHIAVITGIAWDHMNVFPTFDIYKEQFDLFLTTVEKNAKVFCFRGDPEVVALLDRNQESGVKLIPYGTIPNEAMERMKIFGSHNQANLRAAQLVCEELGMEPMIFLRHMESFRGTAKRLQNLIDTPGLKVFFDFAHAPSKLKATIEAVRMKYPEYEFIAIYELHTYSSLNQHFIQQYAGTMDLADHAVVFYNSHTLKMKNMPELSPSFVKSAFACKNLNVMVNKEDLTDFILKMKGEKQVFLFMTSGNFEKLDIREQFQ